MRTHLIRCGLVLLSGIGLASCGPGQNQFAPACPVPGLVRPLAELTRYRGTSHDVRDLVVRARIADIAGQCEPGDNKNSIVATIQIVVDVTRGPALEGNGIGLPVFVAVTDAGSIMDETRFFLPVEFLNNVDSIRTGSKEVRMEIPVTPQKSGAAYNVISGFQLTPEEVAAWRLEHTR